MMHAADWYPHLPVWLQNWACAFYGYKERRKLFASFFREKHQFLLESERWPRDQIRSYQDEQVAALIKHAYDTTPYYRRIFDQHRLKPSDVRCVSDLEKVPRLTKDEVREHYHDMVSSAVPRRKLFHCHTSGSTGKALDFYLTSEVMQFQWAVWWRFRNRFDVHFRQPSCFFTGKLAVPLNVQSPPFWRYNPAIRQSIINMQHLTPQKIGSIVGFLNQIDVVFYSGYPSIIYQLCVQAEQAGLSFSRPPRIVMTGAEKLYDNQRALIQKVLGCPVTDQYGMSEACGNAARCEHDQFHEDFEFGAVRVVDEDDFSPNQGRLICTGFANYAMPLINYEIGDVATRTETKFVCPCGRQSQTFADIEGRSEDFVITPEGFRVLRFDYIFKDSSRVREAQVVQRRLGQIVIRVIRREGYSSQDEQELRDQVRKMISPTIEVEFEYVDHIEPSASGKFRAVVSMLDNATSP